MNKELRIGDLIIDDTPIDLSDADDVFASEEEENAYWEKRRKKLNELKIKRDLDELKRKRKKNP